MNVNKININQSEQSYYIESGAYDVTAHNNGASFASLSALLSSENLSILIPSEVRSGGMSIRFVQSSDNNYVQYNLMSDTFNTTVANWQRCVNVSNYASADCTIEDEAGYAIAIFNEGHIKTKEFDSAKSLKNENSRNDLEISDKADYSVLMVKNGYPKTKNFDGEIIKKDLLNIDKIKEVAGLYETVTVNIADYNNNLMNVYAAINPTKEKHYTILIPEGTYNVNEWFTQAQIETSNETYWRGLELMDYTKLLGIGVADKIILQWMNPDSATHWGYISTLNTNHWHELENLTVKANNIRYAVHDDIWDGKDRYIRVKNCNFIVSGNTTRAWGAGTNGGYDGVFEHCHFIMEYYRPFDTEATTTYINPLCLHDNPYNKGRDSHVVFKNCVFYVPYLNAMYYHPDSWEQITRDESYPEWDNEKLDYVVGDCVNIRYDAEHSYRCIYAGAQVPPCLKGRASFSFGYGGYVESDDADGVLYASIEHCQCNTYYEASAKCERVTGFCNIWDGAYLAKESDTKKNIIMDFRKY